MQVQIITIITIITIMSSRSTFIPNNKNKYVPISPLDNFLIKSNFTDYEINFYDIFDGAELNTDHKIALFYNKVTQNTINNIYPSTDHLIYSITIDDIKFVYVSLDNSAKSNMNGHSLAHTRLENLMTIVKNIISTHPKHVVFFSKSCRPSFITVQGETTDEISWLEMRRTICDITELTFITEKKNNEEPNGLSFGISVWCSHNVYHLIKNYYSLNLLDKGFGSVCVGIKLHSDKIIWGVHFPLDFKNIGNENHGAITAKNLCDVMDKYNGSICAFGDFNLIPGNVNDSVRDTVQNTGYEFVLHDVLTFFGAYYDTIQKSTFISEPTNLNDLSYYDKYKMLQYVLSPEHKYLKKIFYEFIKSNYNEFELEPDSPFFKLERNDIFKIFDMIKNNNIQKLEYESKFELQEINLYPEMFEYFNSDGNLVNGQWAMEDEYSRLRKDPTYKNNLYVIIDSDTKVKFG